MQTLNSHNSFWLDHDGAEIEIEGRAYTLKVTSFLASYPYAQRVISVYAEAKNRSTKYYQEIKAKLHDDWSTDVLASDPELEFEIRQQLVKQQIAITRTVNEVVEQVV